MVRLRITPKGPRFASDVTFGIGYQSPSKSPPNTPMDHPLARGPDETPLQLNALQITGAFSGCRYPGHEFDIPFRRTR